MKHIAYLIGIFLLAVQLPAEEPVKKPKQNKTDAVNAAGPKSPVTAGTLALASAQADIGGRYVRIEAPASSRMGIHEIEVWSDGVNIALKNKELKFAGVGHRGGDINDRNRGWAVIDGIAKFDTRSTEYSTAGAMNPWLEMDFGTERPLDKVVVKSTLKPIYDDRAIRLVTVLDARRRVLWSATYDIRRKPFNEGSATFELSAGKGPLIGRAVPPNTAQWAPLGDVADSGVASKPAYATERLARFSKRNSPAAIEQLAREFCARLDLTNPELTVVRRHFEASEFDAALDTYRDHFLQKLQTVTFLHEHPSGLKTYDLAGDDLLRNIAVVFSRYNVEAQQFEPGAIRWAQVSGDDKQGIETARVRARAGSFQRPLLTAFRKTGDAAYLQRWCEITDDWGMNIRRDLDHAAANGHDLRFYFVKNELQQFNHLADELAQTAREQPTFRQLLPGATLARLLIPVLEEYPPAYWWVCRRATFNHTYNALDAATATSRVLDDFHAGQRLDHENRQHWERVLGMMVTHDGSMNEIGDEGHLYMHWRIGVHFHQMKKSPPPWFTPEFAAEFESRWKQMIAYPIRHMTPDGRGHRVGLGLGEKSIWELMDRTCTYGGMIPREQNDASEILRHPEVEGILQTVFGAGQDRAQLSEGRQESWDRVTGFYGTDFSPPKMTSDWLPYAGLHYLRQSWNPDATFVVMQGTPKGHPSTSGDGTDTKFYLWSQGQPLVGWGAVRIDGQPQFPGADRQVYFPGSKTVQLATTSDRPIQARFHTSERFDFAESAYDGAYQRHGFNYRTNSLDVDETRIEARAERSIIMLRESGLVIVTDRVLVPESERPRQYHVDQVFGSPELGIRGATQTGEISGEASALTLSHETAPGVTVRRFTEADLTWNQGDQPNWFGRGGQLAARTSGDLLITALVDSESTVKSVIDRTSHGVSGFEATLADGAKVGWLAAGRNVRELSIGDVTIQGEGLLVHGNAGLALGTTAMSIGGNEAQIPDADFEFEIRDGKLIATTPIHRPIEPVTISPAVSTFIDETQVTLSTTTPDIEIRYTLDGSEPDLTSPLYTGPFTLRESTYVRARAFRPGLTGIPLTMAGTDATLVTSARFQKRPLLPATEAPPTQPGLKWDLVEGQNWFSLFSHLHLPDVLPATATGETDRLLDVSVRQGDGPFGVRYTGFIKIPADGVWTFHAPPEYVGASCEPGYDLRLWIDGEQWDLGMREHGRGTWNIPLANGAHRILVTFADARDRDRVVRNPGTWRDYPKPWVVWQGAAPELRISGPGIEKQPLPSTWLFRP